MDTSAPDSQALPPDTHLHEFVIERVLGSGGFGITYLARDTGLNRQVVIKENLPSQFAWRETSTGTVRPRHTTGGDIEDYEWSMKNFLREAETLASLDHPGIVRVMRKFESNGTAYFVMPFVEGMTLDTLIEDRRGKGKRFSEDELLGLLERVLAALGYLHDRGIYHRDIKPGNILITNEGIPVLIDFGSARQRISERSLTVIESPGYTPFEQLQTRGDIGPWSDLYAFAATLAKAITFNTPPKAADRMMGDPWAGLAAEPSLSSFSNGFLQSIDRAMAVDPSHRWQSAGEWREFLDGSAVAPVTPAHTFTPPPLPETYVAPTMEKDEPSDSRHPVRKSRSRTSLALKSTIAAACVLLVGALVRPASLYERMRGQSRGFAEMFGETLVGLFSVGIISLIIALIISGILAAFKKPFRESLSRGYSIGILIIASLMLFGNLVSRATHSSSSEYTARIEEVNAKKTLSGIEEDMQKMIEEGTGPDGLPKETDFRFEKKSPPADDAERLRELMQSFFNDMLTLQNDYLAALDEDGLNTLLDADRVAKDTGFRDSRAILARLRKTVMIFRTKADGILEDFPKRLNDPSFGKNLNEALHSGYKEGMGKSLPLMKETWDLEVAVIGHMEELIDHLEATRSHWEPEDGMFMFQGDDDLEKFNAIMAKITACVERQTEIKESAQKSATEKIGSLKARIPE
jgi:serine/threonine protein kinase